MSTYQHVLLAVDYSRKNNFVIKKAHQMAQQNQAKLSIVHVIEHASNDNDHALEDLLDAEQNSLAEIANDLGIPEANQWLRAGMPSKEIIELAREQAVDLIVIGAHHHHGLSRLLGSTFSKTMERVSCDLLAVHLK